ncbi:McrB family protein [Microbacterium sp. RG1]|uniref:McrB family protein n=1 Tax=Microbacterium sp. RG1 TaxID=2489212 RepID=UPI0010CA4289|nr:AAA family ATPase [Microbacterium sp. RG1]QCQ17263.1 AAA family ATPase [Microbacterium sp. RG1]
MFDSLVPNVRLLEADDLGIGVHAKAEAGHASSAPDAPVVTDEHPRVREIVRLAGIYGGVILTGPPGTSKSFFAAAAAAMLAGDKSRYSFVQFHASYQYEDFMVGYSPTKSGFEEKTGPFLKLVDAATRDPEHTYVLVIDELSRADVGRVFGEALTYVERSKRELPFLIANGREIKVPSNLVILATMNPFDRGVDEVDAAFERRFAKVSMEPDRLQLLSILGDSGLEDAVQHRVAGWFGKVNGLSKTNPAAAVGHAYFAGITDESSLADLWDYQLQYVVDRAFRRDRNTGTEVEAAWKRIFDDATDDGDGASALAGN